MRTRYPLRLSLFGLMLALAASEAVFAQTRAWGQDRSITRISEHVYRWGSDNQFGVYVLTEAGIALIDGHYCQSNTVAWLKEELAARYDVPVRYVILSHDHQDHICHTGLFADTATVISHRNLRPHVVREQRDAAVPDVTFEDEMDLHLGDLTLKLYYFGPSHSDNLIHIHIPADEVLVSIDAARSSLFPDLRDFYIDEGIAAYRELSKLDDVRVVVPGHGGLLEPGVFMRMHDFLATLRERVLRRMLAGESLSVIRANLRMDEFSDLGGLAASLDTNIVTMYDALYRYREPNQRIEPAEAVVCITTGEDCRTAND